MRGRKPSLTPAIAKEICDAVRTGASYRTAVAVAGIHPSTFHRWRERGRNAKRGVYREFCDQIDKAKREGRALAAQVVWNSFMESSTTTKVHRRETLAADGSKVAIVEKTETHHPPNTEMALKWLERREPERWKPQVKHEHDGSVDSTVTHDLSGASVTLQMVFDDGDGEPETTLEIQTVEH